ncbi:MAG: hypothetical protein ACRCYU_03015, partial [Nocardioides sp.]
MGVVETIIRPQRSILALILISMFRWRWEITLELVGLYLYLTMVPADWGLVKTALVASAIVAPLLSVGPVRRFIRNRCWCVITRHRVRTCLAQMRT